MSHSNENFTTQNCGQNSSNSYVNVEYQNSNFGNVHQQHNHQSFTRPPHPSMNQFTNYCNMPPPPYLPPQMLPTTNQNFYSNYSAPNVGYCAQQFQPAYETNLNFQNLIMPPPLPSRLTLPNAQLESGTARTSAINASNQDESSSYSNKENSNKNWIDNWLKSIGRLNNTPRKDECNKNTSDVKIYEFKDKIITITTLFNKLENLSKSLSITYKSLNEDEWKLRCCEIEEIKKKISYLLVPLSNNKELLMEMKWKINKRKKKRDRQRRKREEYKKKKVEDSVKRQQLHQSIDQWLEDMKDDVERGRRDEELKRQADNVLSDVTRKKTEAKRQISLLSALLKLRQARVTALTAVGRNISQPQTEAFNDVIERLKSLWTNQLSGYLLEEQGLKVMLNEAVVEEKNSETLRKKEALLEWEEALFGSNKRSIEYQPCDINELVFVRKQWDQFVVDEGTVMASSIPPGWVVPVKASDSNWKKYNNLHHD